MNKFRHLLIIVVISTVFLLLPTAAMAKFTYHHNGFAIGAGVNQASENNADESLAFGLKYRHNTLAGGLDFCMSEGPGGEGSTMFPFVWVAWMEEFSRPEESTYGLYGGLGVGYMLLEEEELMDSPVGPFVILGWDLGEEISVEGKVGMFGENKFGTAMVYWNL